MNPILGTGVYTQYATNEMFIPFGYGTAVTSVSPTHGSTPAQPASPTSESTTQTAQTILIAAVAVAAVSVGVIFYYKKRRPQLT